MQLSIKIVHTLFFLRITISEIQRCKKLKNARGEFTAMVCMETPTLNHRRVILAPVVPQVLLSGFPPVDISRHAVGSGGRGGKFASAALGFKVYTRKSIAIRASVVSFSDNSRMTNSFLKQKFCLSIQKNKNIRQNSQNVKSFFNNKLGLLLFQQR